MDTRKIECEFCKKEYLILAIRCGEIRCPYCESQSWIDPDLSKEEKIRDEWSEMADSALGGLLLAPFKNKGEE